MKQEITTTDTSEIQKIISRATMRQLYAPKLENLRGDGPNSGYIQPSRLNQGRNRS